MTSRSLILSLLAVSLVAPALRAEEGMWTFDNLPTKAIQAKYGWAPDQAWLDHVRLSSLRFPGASGSFVGKDGLVLTNHHVGRNWVQRLSSKDNDLLKNGFSAPTREQELKVPGLELVTLVAMEDITARVAKAVKAGASEKEALKARETEIEKIKKEMQEKSGLTCEHVTLYQGGEHWIYSYRKHTDVRLVFAPELQVALYGGDFDNFTYPRHSLDITLFRVYENGKPFQPKDFLKWTETGVKAGDLTFVTGHPGRTSRQDTFAQMTYSRDFAIPSRLKGLERRKAALLEYGKTSPEAARQVSSQIFGIENTVKSMTGSWSGLKDKEAMKRLADDEKAFRAKVAKDPKLEAVAGLSWSKIEGATKAAQKLAKDAQNVGTANSTLLGYALSLVRIADEEALPSEQRLPEYSDANLKNAKTRLGVPGPFHLSLHPVSWTRSGLRSAFVT